MSSAIQYLTENIKDIVRLILYEYKGLREEELNTLNPDYSCVICAKHYSEDCLDSNIFGGACENHRKLNIDTFATKYNFKEKEGEK